MIDLEQALEELKITHNTLQAQQQEIEALKTKLLYLTETEIVKTRAELANLTDDHDFTQKMLQKTGNQIKQIQGTVKETLEQEVTATKTLIQQTQKEAENLLVGAVMAFAMPEAPEGWLACDGEEISRTEYARLFERISIIFGEGDGETTFNLPDLRGLFVRGWDNAGQIDPEREFATGQYDQIQTHSHSTSLFADKVIIAKAGAKHVGKGRRTWYSDEKIAQYLEITQPTSASSENPIRYGHETRPKNIALLYCIKY